MDTDIEFVDSIEAAFVECGDSCDAVVGQIDELYQRNIGFFKKANTAEIVVFLLKGKILNERTFKLGM
jgi:hypothetical protein